jgi:polyisoprenoid-binding protein YceI
VRTFVVVPEESQASYIVDEEFLSEALSKLGIEAGKTVVVGTTPGVSGEIQLNLEGAEPVESAQFSVDMTGLQTDQDRRDNWLKDNAIETSRFPAATFTATSVTGLPESINEGEEISFELTGDLMVRDVTKSVTFAVTAVLQGDTLEGPAVLPLKISDFGIAPPDFANTLTVADEFRIEVVLTARES